MKIKAFLTHKLDERYSDCADSFAVNPNCKRIAISDGVSQSFSPQDWSKLLVNDFVAKAYTPKENDEQLLGIQDVWRQVVLQNFKKLEDAGEVTWMMENCIEDKESAGATFCGIELRDDTFHLWVLGDSALVTVHDNLEYKLYTTQDGEFNNRPDYLDSYGAHVGNFREYDIPLGDFAYILLVTDPFSDLLHQCNNNDTAKEILRQLLSVNTHEDFCTVVDGLRANYSMHNDDSTFVSIQLDGNCEFNYLYHTDIESLINSELQKKVNEGSAEHTNIEIDSTSDGLKVENKPFLVSEIINKKRTISRVEPVVSPENSLKLEQNQSKSGSDETEATLPLTNPTSQIAEDPAPNPIPPEPEGVSMSEEEISSEVKLSLTYDEFLACSKDAFDAMHDLIESKGFISRLFANKLTPCEFEEIWLAIANKFYKK